MAVAVLISGPVRPLVIARVLAPVTRFALPAEAAQPGPDILRYLQDVAERVRRVVRETLLAASAGGDGAQVLAAVDGIGTELAAGYEAQFARQRAGDADLRTRMAAVECRKGCDFCCHVNVTVTVLEAVRIAAALAAGRQPQRQSEILATAERLAGRDAEGRQALRAACPLLVDGACSVYEIRPLACRALLSQSARSCEAHFAAVGPGGRGTSLPSLVTPRLIAAGFVSGEMAAMQDLGLAGHLVELTASLALMLGEPTALPRWLAGEDVFARP
jgi:hypothetical protein